MGEVQEQKTELVGEEELWQHQCSYHLVRLWKERELLDLVSFAG